MEWIKCIFSGIGTWLLSAFLKILPRGKGEKQDGKHTRFKQIQKGRDSSEQEQIYSIESGVFSEHVAEEDTNVVQKQIAGNNSKQTQIGVIKNGHKF